MVAAKESALRSILEGTKQYQVPLYQRTYSWTTDQVRRLWEDVVLLAEDRVNSHDHTHFIGSLVLAPSPSLSPAGVQAFLVIDGQQRLTTLTLLLAAIRDHRGQHEHESHRDRINDQFLINKWETEQPLKVLPTQTDRDAYSACIRGLPLNESGGNIGSAFRFFQAQLVAFDDPDDPLDIERIEDAVINGLTLVAVTAQPGDNVHRIFESLNNTGLKLTQGDLLRNYYFMRLIDRAQLIYDSVWKPMQDSLAAAEIELLFWIDLVEQDPTAKQDDVYSLQQARLDRLTPDEVEKDLIRVGQLGTVLARVLSPETLSDPVLTTRLMRLRRWKTTTVMPVLVTLMNTLNQEPDRHDEISEALLYLESFLVRRILIGRAQVNLNRILLGAVKELSSSANVARSLRTYLSSGRKYWATDEQVRAAALTVPFYWQGRANQKRLILAWLDESLGSKEITDYQKLTIEHLMPQTLSDTWRETLLQQEPDPDTMQARYDELVQTLGNLTLTAYNSEMSNNSWDWKSERLASSALWMNQAVSKQPTWGFSQIEERGRELADAAIALWPGPDPALVDEEVDERWKQLNQLLIEIPPGRWTSYGDLATVLGTFAMPVGSRLANHPAENAHRVLRASGRISPDFRWPDPDRTDDPRLLLESEGVTFDSDGKASKTQRIRAEELAHLAGIAVPGEDADDFELDTSQ